MPIMTSAVNRTNGPLSGPNVRSSRPGDGGRGGGASLPLLAVEGGGRGGGRATRGDGGRHLPPCMSAQRVCGWNGRSETAKKSPAAFKLELGRASPA